MRNIPSFIKTKHLTAIVIHANAIKEYSSRTHQKSGPKAMITKSERELPKDSKSLMLSPFLLWQ